MKVSLFADTIDHALADRLRRENQWARPRPLGLAPSIGLGDRLGVATAGHIRAMREHAPAGVRAVFAQQSVRELARTHQTHQEVLDSATLAVARADYREPWGADADHLKTEDDVRAAAAAGFTFFTADPSAFVNDRAAAMTGRELDGAVEQALADETPAVRDRWLKEPLDARIAALAGGDDPLERRRAIATYARAVAHTERLYRAAQAAYRGPGHFDFEMSVDETATPTTPIAHALIVRELLLRGVRLTSLAIRFVGDFQKAINYIGDKAAFRAHLKKHAALARALGHYKISVHSGSDKFAIYPILAEEAPGLIHLKTAGTSFLEALRLVARHDPPGMRRIVALALERFAEDTATYHTTTNVARVLRPESVADADLETVYLGQDDARQVLHITYGSCLACPETANLLKTTLLAHPDEYAGVLSAHFAKHLTAFPAT